jgi:hypothetical protein
MADDPRKGSSGISGGGLLGAAAALATVIAAIVGTLNQLGYIGNHDATRATEISAPAPPSEEPAYAPGSAVSNEARSEAGSAASPSQLASIKPGKHPTLNGAWRDMVGGCHLITQTGSKLEVTNYFPDSGAVMSHGDGTVAGSQIQVHLRTMHGDFQVSPDGTVLSGTMFRLSGPGHSIWKYVGASCQKSG